MGLRAGHLTALVAILAVSATTAPARANAAGSGPVWAWGDNEFGELGTGSATAGTPSTTPVAVKGPGGVGTLSASTGFGTGKYPIATGQFHTVAVKADGTVWDWGGDNVSGQLGDGTTNPGYTPVQVLGPGGTGTLTGVVAVAAGASHTLALKSNGTVWTWGSTSFGQLGNGTDQSPLTVCTQCETAPVQVVGPGGTGHLTNIVAIAAGSNVSLALDSTGHVWAWGQNQLGQLGQGVDTSIGSCFNNCSDTPVEVKGPGGTGVLTGVTGISAYVHELAVDSTGHVWAWGYNNMGQLGNGSTTGPDSCFGSPCAMTPVQVKDSAGTGFLSGIAQVAAGYDHSIARASNGSVWTWGDNIEGQLGDNGTTNSSLPVQVAGPGGTGTLTGVTGIVAAHYHSLAVKSDGSVWAWGWNEYGQLGVGNRTGPDTCDTNQACATAPARVVGRGGVGTLSASALAPGGDAVWSVAVGQAVHPAPAVVTGPASQVAETSATFNGTVNPNGSQTTYHFEYGTDTTYGMTVPVPDASAGAGTSVQRESQPVAGLAPGTTYHYRIVAKNAGGTKSGSDQTFTTPAASAGSYQLMVQLAGSGGGSVTSQPAGISCGTSCAADFATGTSVTLTPTADSRSTFSGWSGDCQGSGSCTVAMNQARSVIAIFTVNTSGGGGGGGGGLNFSAPVPHIDLTGNSPSLPSALQLSAVGTDPGGAGAEITDYVWTIGSSTSSTPHNCGQSTNMSFSANRAGTYSVALTAINSAGLSSTVQMAVSFPAGLLARDRAHAALAIGNAGAWALACSGGHRISPTCITSFQFGIIDAESDSSCVSVKRERIVPAARDASVNPQAIALPEDILNHDVATITGGLTLNGLHLPFRPSHVSTLDTEGSIDLGTADVEAGPYTLANVGMSFPITAWTYTDRQQIGDFSLGGGSHLLDGLPVSGTVSLSLGYQTAVVGAAVRLPDFLSLADGSSATLSGTATLSYFQDPQFTLHASFPKIDIGPLTITDVSIDYDQRQDLLKIGGTIDIAGAQVQLTPVPPNGVIIEGGAFKSGGANFVFPDCCEPEIFPGIDLKSIGASLQLNPTVLEGRVQLDVLGLATVNGSVLVAFPSGDAPFTLTPAWLPGIPDSLNGQTFYSSPVIGASGDVTVTVPVIGDLTLATGYVVYGDPGYLWAGGGIDFDILGGLLKWGGHIDGAFNSQTHAFDVEGYVYGSIADVLSGSLHAVISSQGVGGCADIAGLDVGGGVQWARVDEPYIYPWGCVFDRFTEDHVFGARDIAHRADASQSPQSFTAHIPRHAPTQVIRLKGAGGAPAVRVTAPGGGTLSSPAGAGLTRSGNLAIIRSEQMDMTEVGIRQPRPGAYRVTALPGSPQIIDVATALAPPPAKVTAKVLGSRGSGDRRTLVYNIRPRPDQTVTFYEVNSQRLWRQIGSVTGGGRGRLRFIATPDKRGQRILATVALHGVPDPSARITVARFRPPSLAPLPRPRKVLVRHTRRAVIVSWLRVPEAGTYAVVVRQPTDGARVALVAGTRRRARVVGLDPLSGGTVTVTALPRSGRHGIPAQVRFKAVAKKRHRAHKPKRRHR